MGPKRGGLATPRPSGQYQSTMKSPTPSSPQQLDDSIEPISVPGQLNRRETSTPSSIPQSCRIDSNAQITWDPKPKAQSKPERAHDSLWRRALAAIRTKYHKLWGRRKGKWVSYDDDEDDPYVRTILVAFKDEQGKEILRHARAKFDTGNPENLVSPAFVETFGSLVPDERNERVILDLPGRGKYVSIARLAGRWTCRLSDSHFSFDPKFMDAEFEVSNSTERFDVVIGSDTLKKEGIMKVRRDLGLTGFRTKTTSYNQAEIDEAEEQQRKRREENEARKKALLAKKSSPAQPAGEKQ